jgi:hypothetical protein
VTPNLTIHHSPATPDLLPSNLVLLLLWYSTLGPLGWKETKKLPFLFDPQSSNSTTVVFREFVEMMRR